MAKGKIPTATPQNTPEIIITNVKEPKKVTPKVKAAIHKIVTPKKVVKAAACVTPKQPVSFSMKLRSSGHKTAIAPKARQSKSIKKAQTTTAGLVKDLFDVKHLRTPYKAR